MTEQERRKPEWVEGTPIVLSDGAAWSFPRPVVVFEFDDATELGFQTRMSLHGDDGTYSRLAREMDQAEGGNAIIRSQLAMGAYLLRRNYDLTTAEVAALMPFGYGDGNEPSRIKDEVCAVAMGIGPKP